MDVPPSESPHHRSAAHQSLVELDAAQATPFIPAPASWSGDAAAARGDRVLRPPALTEFDTKYPPDEYGEELADNARVWTVYKDQATVFDGTMLDAWNKTLDILLIFAGLFSAVVTTFAAVSAQALQPDYTQMSFYVLLAMASTNNTAVPDMVLASLRTPPAVPRAGRVVNVFWFVSLLLSLSTALLSILAKQWLSEYTINETAVESTRHWARLRQFRFDGLSEWHVPTIIGMLPALLHWSLFLFFTGVVVQMWSLDFATTGLTLLILVLMVGFYCASIALPWWHPQCPYHNPLLNQTIKVAGMVGLYARKFGSQATRLVHWAHAQIQHFFGALNLDFLMSPVPDISGPILVHRLSVPLQAHHAPVLAVREAELVNALTIKLDAKLLLWMLDSSPQFNVREVAVYGLAAVPAFSLLANHLNELGVQRGLKFHIRKPLHSTMTPQYFQYIRAHLTDNTLDLNGFCVLGPWWCDAYFDGQMPGMATFTEILGNIKDTPTSLFDCSAKMMPVLSLHILEIIWCRYRMRPVPQQLMSGSMTAEHDVLTASIAWFRTQQPLLPSQLRQFVDICLAEFPFACNDMEYPQLSPTLLAQILQDNGEATNNTTYLLLATEIWIQVAIDSDRWELDESTLAALFEIIGVLLSLPGQFGVYWRTSRCRQLACSGHRRDLWKWSGMILPVIIGRILEDNQPPGKLTLAELSHIVTELMNTPWQAPWRHLNDGSGPRFTTSSIWGFVTRYAEQNLLGSASSSQVPFGDMVLGLDGCNSPLPLLFSQKLRIPWGQFIVELLWILLHEQPSSNNTHSSRMQVLLEHGVVDIITVTLDIDAADENVGLSRHKLLCALRLFYDFAPVYTGWETINSIIMEAVHRLSDITVESLNPW